MIQIKAAFLDGGSLTLILIYLEIFLAQKIWAMYKAFHLITNQLISFPLTGTLAFNFKMI